ncbi:MAG: hypothetical protein Q4D98_00755 [Planctomycetia bacterium]|nr:hypothetical protein [Planctomycetia bacterium]
MSVTQKKFLIGWQPDERLADAVFRHADMVAEIYFPWEHFPSGRGVVRGRDVQRRLELDLSRFADAGLGMNLLLNGNCYGRHALSRVFFQDVGDTVTQLLERVGLRSVTTTSPLIAKFLKRNFPTLEVRASVNMEIGNPTAMAYLTELFDGFYLKREFNRDFDRIREVRKWCDEQGKKLYLLANSGCLNFCPARAFHDNLVAHEHEIVAMDNAFAFRGLCHEFLSHAENRRKILQITNFIRPEDLAAYVPFFDGIKLATRTNRNPAAVVEAYATGHFSGNVLDLTEPAHSGSFYPLILDNTRFPEDFGNRTGHCGGKCVDCDFCETTFSTVSVFLEE